MSTNVQQQPELRRSHGSSDSEELGLDDKSAPHPQFADASEKQSGAADEVHETDASKPLPYPDGYVEETHQLTFRALLVGSALGCIVAASNIYLGLKTGFTFGASLFGAIFGYALIKPLSRIPESGILGRFLGGTFGPKENCTVQTAATAAGGMGILFVSAVPAMYRLGLLSPLPEQDMGKLIALCIATAFFGVFFVIPLRKYYIIKQKLTFPSPTATAVTIRALHSGKSGAVAAKKKSRMLLYSLLAVFFWKVASGYAPGVLLDWHLGWTLYQIGWTSIISMENYGWFLEITPAFFGAGMLSGLNASWSFFGGSVLAWGVIAPSLVKNGLAVMSPLSKEYPLFSPGAMSFTDTTRYITSPSPRYWLLWPGVLIMLVNSLVEITLSLTPFWKTVPSQLRNANLNPVTWFRKDNDAPLTTGVDPENEDPSPPEDQVPTLWWTIGLAVTTVGSCAIFATMFHMNVGEAILALLLGFMFSFIGVQSSGQTDVNPVGTVAKASQLIFGGVTKGMSMIPAQTINLTAGVVAAGAAAQATDMTGDLKTGFLLRAKPRNQFLAQCIGSFISVFLNVGLFVLFTKASPCIITGEDPCAYGAPSISAWAAVAVAVTSPKLPIPPSSGYTAIGLSIAAGLTVTAKYFLIPKKFWGYIPNWNAIGLGFVVPQVFYSIAMAVGSVVNFYWQKRNPSGHDMYMFALGAGLLAGEGLGGVFQALLAVAKVDGGSGYGTAVGCPGFEFCG